MQLLPLRTPWNPHLISAFTLPCRTQCARPLHHAHTKPPRAMQATFVVENPSGAVAAQNGDYALGVPPISHRFRLHEFIRATESPESAHAEANNPPIVPSAVTFPSVLAEEEQ